MLLLSCLHIGGICRVKGVGSLNKNNQEQFNDLEVATALYCPGARLANFSFGGGDVGWW